MLAASLLVTRLRRMALRLAIGQLIDQHIRVHELVVVLLDGVLLELWLEPRFRFHIDEARLHLLLLLRQQHAHAWPHHQGLEGAGPQHLERRHELPELQRLLLIYLRRDLLELRAQLGREVAVEQFRLGL